MFGIGANELLLILLFGFLIFGPDKLPAMAKTIGRAIAKFRNAQNEMSDVIKKEVYDPDAEDPFKNPLDAISKIENDVKKEDKGESFTARKARYDKQRAARKAAEERKAANEAKKAAEAAGATAVAAAAAPKEEASKKVAPKVSADELYGTKPVAKRPARKVASSGAKAPEPVSAPKKNATAGSKAEAKPATKEEKGE
ncbi:twin-arginine translocase TatA/TatE family subunit [Denitrobacterium detoxificans]|uniref:Sec-independent protein translocase subunit TatA/TatB n=1 Tax=Denitrobacterium detoxificans TaxID=79604 RepID=UPI0026E92DD1|nr:twin-arginine translocase TatA/TatE family subunit [Denitrobacterium detoxificans]MBE6466310.1 translocase [Denitrobacterium detoxificans]